MTVAELTLDAIGATPPPPGPDDWNAEGVVVLPSLIDDERIEAYERAWVASNGPRLICPTEPLGAWTLHATRPGGWPDCTPYMRHPEILDLLAPVAPHVERLLGEPAGVHLNLTGWVSTTRNWHADGYLNPRTGPGDGYAAVWVALGDIHRDAGPFQFVPGSHRWPQITQDVIGRYYDLGDPRWPAQSEGLLTDLYEREIMRRQAPVVTYLPHRGDVLIWHGRLLHRGTVPNVAGAYRPAFIAHLSAISRRPDMPAPLRHDSGTWYFPIGGFQTVGR